MYPNNLFKIKLYESNTNCTNIESFIFKSVSGNIDSNRPPGYEDVVNMEKCPSYEEVVGSTYSVSSTVITETEE